MTEEYAKLPARSDDLTLNGEPLYETPPIRNGRQIEHRTSNVQHRTSNNDGATLYLFKNKRITLRMLSKDSRILQGGQESEGRFALLSLF